MPVSRISPGLIARSFGLLAIVENTRVVLPLKAVRCEFSVAAGLVEVQLTRVFRKSEPEFQAIRQWAFADSQHWLERSTLVAALLWNLFQLADRYRLAVQPINKLLEELERKQGKPGARALGVRMAIIARSWTETELAQMIETEFQARADSRLLADFVRIPEAMHQAIEAFARQHLKT